MLTNYNHLTKEQKAIELLKCRNNPLYFICNYVKIDDGGVPLLYGKVIHPKIKRVIRILYKYHSCILMASRQLGKSTIAAAMILWAMTFFPRTKCVVINMDKKARKVNIDKIKFMWSYLPDFMKIQRHSRTEIETYFTLKNGSDVRAFSPSSTTPPDQIARSMTAPILYIDEASHIYHMEKIYGAAYPILTRAKEQAEKYNRPYFQLVTSTPNGIYAPESRGDVPNWFYETWQGALDSDDIFVFEDNGKYEKWIDEDEINKRLKESNRFIKVRFHWSEDPNKDEEWYEEQKSVLTKRRVNQELDLKFVGSQHCILEDDVLEQIESMMPVNSIPLPHLTKLKLYTNFFDPKDYYIIGVDTASSIKGAYSAIEVFQYSNFSQVAEFYAKLGSLTKYGEIVLAVFEYIKKVSNSRVILAIENNSIGQAIIEYCINNSKIPIEQYIHSDSNRLGINTNPKTKELMIASLIEYINDSPKTTLKSDKIISQISSIERSPNGTIKSSGYTDMVMAAAFCAYVRKRTYLEILPLINKTQEEVNKQQYQLFSDLAKAMDPKYLAEQKTREQQKLDNNIIPTIPSNQKEEDEIPYYGVTGEYMDYSFLVDLYKMDK